VWFLSSIILTSSFILKNVCYLDINLSCLLYTDDLWMPIPVAPYDPDNRFMKCARDHKLEALERSSVVPDSDNRFAQCALENKMRNRSVSEPVSYDSDNRFTQCARSERSYSISSPQISPQTRYTERRTLDTEYRPREQMLLNSPKSVKKDSLAIEDFPSLSPLCSKSPKAVLMSPLRTTITSSVAPVAIATVLSVKDGKVTQTDIYENIEPLTITPSKWSDVLKYTPQNTH